jgi:hypothetical protein
LRKEYVFKKQLEGTERELYEKRKRLKTAIDGKHTPVALRFNF